MRNLLVYLPLTLSRGGVLSWQFRGGGQKRLHHIFWPCLSHLKSGKSGIKSKCKIHKMRPHEEKQMCKNFENWPSNPIFCSPHKNSETSQQKSRKCVFRPFLNRHQKKLFYSLLLIRQKYYESSKTELSDSPFFINRLTHLIFFRVSKKFSRG